MKKLLLLSAIATVGCSETNGSARLERVGDRPALTNPIPVSAPDYRHPGDTSVTIYSDIGKDGRALNCRVQPSPNPDYNAAALRYCQNAVYKPAYKNGKPAVERNRITVMKFHQKD